MFEPHPSAAEPDLRQDAGATNAVSPRHAFVLVDKPAGLTSFRTAGAAARRLGLRKAGHTGTLDSNVTGLLVVALGEATKAIPLLEGMDKEYVGALRLAVPVPEARLRAAAAAFLGVITQTPPELSAVKRVPRQRTVHAFDLGPLRSVEADFHIVCEAGTYVRQLLADLGEALRVEIVMAALRRTSVGPFRIEEATRLDEVKPADLIPIERLLARVGIPVLLVTVTEETLVRHGIRIPPGGRLPTDMVTVRAVSLIGPAGRIIALARPEGDMLRPFRVFQP